MTELLHMKDNYVRRFSARILEVLPEGVVLDRTAFYPLGGGVACHLDSSDVAWVHTPPHLSCANWQLRAAHQRAGGGCALVVFTVVCALIVAFREKLK